MKVDILAVIAEGRAGANSDDSKNGVWIIYSIIVVLMIKSTVPKYVQTVLFCKQSL